MSCRIWGSQRTRRRCKGRRWWPYWCSAPRSNPEIIKLLSSAKTGYILVSNYPDPDPQDPHVFGPPGSRSISQKDPDLDPYLYQQAKIIRKTLIPTVLWLLLDVLSSKNYLLDVLSSKNYVNVHSKSNKQKTFWIRIRIHTKISWIRNTACKGEAP